jgi:hypothetical protein
MQRASAAVGAAAVAKVAAATRAARVFAIGYLPERRLDFPIDQEQSFSNCPTIKLCR